MKKEYDLDTAIAKLRSKFAVRAIRDYVTSSPEEWYFKKMANRINYYEWIEKYFKT